VPILVRPVREQLEHDRIIRLLQAKYRRKFRVDMNPGDERAGSLSVGSLTLFPDLILWDDSPKKPYAVVEVETGESVNHLEAMSQWANFAKSKSWLYLYVPAASVDAAKRLCTDHDITLTELTSYVVVGDQIRFNIVSKTTVPEPVLSGRPPQEKAPKPEKTVEAPPEPVAVAAPAPKRVPEPAPVARAAAEKPIQPAAPKVAKLAVKAADRAPAKPEKPLKPEKKVAVKAAEPKPAPKPEPKPAPPRAVAKPAARAAAPAKPPARPEKRAVAPARPVAKAKTVTKAAPRAAHPPARSAPPKARAAASRVAARPAAKRAPAAKPRPKAVPARASGKAAQKRK
jgi:hypothetical protein